MSAGDIDEHQDPARAARGALRLEEIEKFLHLTGLARHPGPVRVLELKPAPAWRTSTRSGVAHEYAIVYLRYYQQHTTSSKETS